MYNRLIAVLMTALMIAPAMAAEGSLIVAGPNANAPEQLQQFGQFEGVWKCSSQSRQPDGSWKKRPGMATWTWHYVLDGHAVQDLWEPDLEANPKAAIGTNLRTYDAETDTWHMVWTTTQEPVFATFRAGETDGALVMFGERSATPAFPQRLARITFHNISDVHFDWKYEASRARHSHQWREVSRLSCDREGESGG